MSSLLSQPWFFSLHPLALISSHLILSPLLPFLFLHLSFTLCWFNWQHGLNKAELKKMISVAKCLDKHFAVVILLPSIATFHSKHKACAMRTAWNLQPTAYPEVKPVSMLQFPYHSWLILINFLDIILPPSLCKAWFLSNLTLCGPAKVD